MAAGNIQVCRLSIDPNAPPEVDGRRYVEGEKLPASAAQAKRLKAILANPKSYSFDIAKGCGPTYGVRFLFSPEKAADDTPPIALNLCFECNILTLTRANNTLGDEDFDNARAGLVALCKELFPRDEEIQSLEVMK